MRNGGGSEPLLALENLHVDFTVHIYTKNREAWKSLRKRERVNFGTEENAVNIKLGG